MGVRKQKHVILHVEFYRTVSDGAVGAVVYTMSKSTPFGRLTVSDVTTLADCARIGQDRMDGKMFTILSEYLNREEHDRVLEAAANSAFASEQKTRMT